MANTIITKNSITASAVPTSGQLVQGELAVNVTDKRLFTENSAGTVVEVGVNPSSITTGNLTATGAVTIPDNAISGNKVEGGTINAVTINTMTSGSVVITGGSITGITDLAIADGGTAASTANAGFNNLAPTQTSNAGKYLTTDGSDASWGVLDIPTAAYGRVVRTAGTITTTSTSLVDLPDATITFTTGAFPISVGGVFNSFHGTLGGEIRFNIDIDGALQLGTTGALTQVPVANYSQPISLIYQSAALSAASHTMKIQWSTNAGTAYVSGTTSIPYVFSAQEIR